MRRRWRIEILFPVTQGAAGLSDLRDQLVQTFGGATIFERAPATGLWKPEGQQTEQDAIVVVETMADSLDPQFWRDFRRDWERRLGQSKLLILTTRVLEL